MSFTNTIGPAAKLSGTLLRGTSLVAMSRTVGIVVTAGLLAAVYQTASDETRTLLTNLRNRSRFRRMRHEAILMSVLGSTLPPSVQDRLLRSRDAFRAALVLLADPALSETDKAVVRGALHRACNPQI